MMLNHRFGHHGPELIAKTKESGRVKDMTLRYWDFRFSNVCNFKCRSCGPELSSGWAKDHTKRNELLGYPIDVKDLTKPDRLAMLWEQIEPSFPYVEEIYFAGGEPLIMEDQMEFAPPGTKQPTIFGQEPAQEVVNLFQGIDKEALSDKIAELNLFNFEDLDLTKLPDVSEVEPQKSLFDVALSMPPAPPSSMVMPIDVEPKLPVKQLPPVIPNVPVFSPEPEPQLFAQPVSTPVIPTNLVGLPTFTQPPVIREPMINVEDIVSPIRTGSTRVRTPNLFNIV